MANHLFLASTPFNMLCSAMVAFELPATDNAILGLIDQPDIPRDFVKALMEWPDSPFNKVELLSNQAKGKAKRQIRRRGFANIDHLLAQFSAHKVYTGNDRRIEFQYAMYKSRQAEGCYLDDGTYSYIGRNTHWLKDKVLDNLIKKISYGWWWSQPSTIGASSWISTAVLAFPNAAIAPLKEKKVEQLPQNLDRSEFKQLAGICIQDQMISADNLQEIEALLLLPHRSVCDDSTLNKLTYWLANQAAKMGFKHHPRTELKEQSGDKTDWGIPDSAIQVPAGIPMEILLPLLNSECHLAGDVSTALLTAKWLRSELSVTAFAAVTTQDSWLQLLRQLHIHVVRA